MAAFHTRLRQIFPVYSSIKKWGICAIFSFLLSSCGDGGQGPYLLAQICVQDRDGINLLIEEINSIARENRMIFIDNSEKTKRDLKTIGSRHSVRSDGSPLINVAIDRNDGLRMSASNISLPNYQFVIGFIKGMDDLETDQFVKYSIKRIEKHWSIYKIPPGIGALPMENFP